MAVTKSPYCMVEKAGSIVAAALALPGVFATPTALADTAPESGVISTRYLNYKDWQPGLDRIRVSSPSLYLLAPISPKWTIEGSGVADGVSGATPRYHSSISGATKHMSDERKAGDVKITHYQERSTYFLGVSKSKEHDYDSAALSLGASFSSEDNNRVWNIGFGHSGDKISSTNDPSLHDRRNTNEFIVGVTQALSPTDLVQVNLSLTNGRGSFSDPYKTPDSRPRKRDQSAMLLRWNHYVDDFGATIRSSYRYYSDTFGIKAHTGTLEWFQPIAGRYSIAPSLRYYSQSAASFYFDPVYDRDVGAPYPPGYFTNTPQFISPDQRLSAFGAWSVGLKLSMSFNKEWSGDIKFDRYEQRSNYRFGGGGSTNIDPFSAAFVQIGLNRRF